MSDSSPTLGPPLSRAPSYESYASSGSYAYYEEGNEDLLVPDAEGADGAPTGAATATGTDTQSFPAETLRLRMLSDIARVVEDTGVSPGEAHLLLVRNHRVWDADATVADYFDDAASMRVIAKCTAGPDPPPLPDDTASILDPVSLEEVPLAECDAPACGHWFPRDAWRAYLAGAVREPGAPNTRCLAYGSGCEEIVRPRMFAAYCTSEEYALYEKQQLEQYCRMQPQLVWCPWPGCNQIVCYSGGAAGDVLCAQGHAFCFACGTQGGHAPARCSEVQQWVKKETDDGLNALWLTSNTKQCPQCKKPIEKNQGCNHMTCRTSAGGCGYEFCWMCLKNWHKHAEGYGCNKLPDAGMGYDATAARQSAVELQRYIFYFERYNNHRRAEQFAADSQSALVDRVRQLQDMLGLRWEQVSFVVDSLRTILRCRRVARWSYCHAYYISGAEKALFEFNQGMLEDNLERLHERLEARYVESVISEEGGGSAGRGGDTLLGRVMSWRSDVVNLASATDRFMSQLCEAVESGFMAAHFSGMFAPKGAPTGAPTGATTAGGAGSGSGNGSGNETGAAKPR